MFTVDTVYRARIEYDVPDEPLRRGDLSPLERVSRFGHRLHSSLTELCVTENGAGPCWNAYWIIEGSDHKAVEDAARKLCGYIRRFKGHRFYE